MDVFKLRIPLEVFTNESNLILTKVLPSYVYENGKPSDSLRGYRYQIVDDSSFEQYSVLIESQTPFITQEELDSYKNDHVYVNLENAYVRLYRKWEKDANGKIVNYKEFEVKIAIDATSISIID